MKMITSIRSTQPLVAQRYMYLCFMVYAIHYCSLCSIWLMDINVSLVYKVSVASTLAYVATYGNCGKISLRYKCNSCCNSINDIAVVSNMPDLFVLAFDLYS